ncbi:MAG TPA: ATP-binding protein [Candidatus Udaeobacter sp.]|jgi:PAS domain S-box-containing protein
MSWITVVWSINAGACFVLAGIYFVVWCNQRDSWPHLLFSCSAVSAAVVGLIELAMLHGNTVEQYATLIRWIHVPVWVLTLSFVAFVRLYLRAGRAWLAWSIYGLRTLVLIVNFILTPNINFRAITSLRHFSWWGEMVSVPVGATSPWSILSNFSLLLLLIFCVDATITVWRRGDRRRALVVGGSMILGGIVAWHVPLVIWGVIDVPFFLSFAYSGIVLAMGSELSDDMFQAAQLAYKLKRSEQRLNLAADSANLGMWEWDLEKDEIWVTSMRRAQLGFPISGKITSKDLMSRWHPDDRDNIRQAMTEAIQSGKDYQAEFRIVLADASVSWVSARGRVQVDDHGKPMRLLGVSLDITARKEAEILAQQQRDELEQLRQQRTTSLEREVVERARLEREVIESCGREQRRIAYDLHDGIGQQLVGIALSAKLLEQELQAEWPVQARKASEIVRLANETARHTRLTARSLEGADGVGDLKVALEALAAKIRKNCRVAAHVKADVASFPVSAPASAQLYRIVQEALHNAVEHGCAHKVRIDLTVDSDNMVLTVRDDGKGFDGAAASNGMGLRIMRYRAQCIGGSCEVQSNGAQGTIVTCRVPLQPDVHVRPIA